MRLVTAPADTTLTSRDLAAGLAVPYTHVARSSAGSASSGRHPLPARPVRRIAVTELGRTAQVGWLASKLEGDGEGGRRRRWAATVPTAGQLQATWRTRPGTAGLL